MINIIALFHNNQSHLESESVEWGLNARIRVHKKYFRFFKHFMYTFEVYRLTIYNLVVVFADGPGDWGLIPGRVIPKTQKMLLDTSLLKSQHYKVRIKGKKKQYRERSRVSLSPAHRCCSNWKGCLQVALDYGLQLYLLCIYIYIYIYISLNSHPQTDLFRSIRTHQCG